MEKINYKQAKAEFDRWVEAKKLSSKTLEKHRDDEETIIDAIQEGYLVLDEDLNLIQELKFPIEKAGITQLQYPLRITEGELAASTKGIRGIDDLVGQMVIGYVSALTGIVKGHIRILDPVDMSIAKAIAAFFSL